MISFLTLLFFLISLCAFTDSSAGEKRVKVADILSPKHNEPLLIAHRGLSARYPENTMAAFRAAVGAGAAMLELDVGLSSDDRVVVLHDATLERTTNGTGWLADFPLAHLRKLDAGSWFAPRFAGEKLPTLAEVLDLVRGRCAVNIEIKAEAVSPRPEGGIEEKVIALVRDRHMEEEVLVSSFDPTAVTRIKKIAPSVRTALLYGREIDFDPVPIVSLCGADGLNMNRLHVTSEIVGALHRAGLFLCVYTVDDPGELKKLISLRVDGIFTNDIEAAARLLIPGAGSGKQ